MDDVGLIEGENFLAEVVASYKVDNKILHRVKILRGDGGAVTGHQVRARVDAPRRHNTERNHSATHLVHEALRRVLGTHVQQQGSLVAPDRLRFDFNHFERISPEQLRAIEDIVNDKIASSIPVHALNDPNSWLTIDEAKRRYPNVKMFFGDKYGERVRIVEIDPQFSVELCGGTHVHNTRDIGLFKIIGESSIASGIRRIDAVTGDGLQKYIEGQLRRAGELDDALGRMVEEKQRLERDLGFDSPYASPPSLGGIPAGTVPASRKLLSDVEALIREREEALEKVTRETRDLEKNVSRQRVQEASSSIDRLIALGVPLHGFSVVSATIRAQNLDELKSIGDTLRERLGTGVGVLASIIEGKVALVCVVTDDLIKARNLKAGKIVGAIAKQLGGGGGGRDHLATAGAKDVGKLEETLKNSVAIVRSLMEH